MKWVYLKSAANTSRSDGLRWAEALNCKVIPFDAFPESCQNGASYDLILMDIDSASLGIAESIASRIQANPGSILIFIVGEFLPNNHYELNAWMDVLSMAHILIGSTQNVCKSVREKTRLDITELASPYDIEELRKAYTNNPPNINTFTVITDQPYFIRNLIREIGLPLYLLTRLKYPIQIIRSVNRGEVQKAISASAIVFIPLPLDDEGFVVVCSALAGAVLVSHVGYTHAKGCYPYTMFDPRHNRRAIILLWIYTSRSFQHFFIENARHSLVNFNKENKRDAFINKVAYKVPDITFALSGTNTALSLKDQMQHAWGPRHIFYDVKECVVVCLLMNGEEYIPSFLAHYRAMGIKHFFFIDNGSQDKTLELLKGAPDVTVYQTSLQHKYYENEIRRLIIEEHCRHRWCLNVDIDELFDYPCSDQLPLSDLLSYLRENGYTAMAGYMLDMFNKGNLFDVSEKLDLKEAYPYYDISNIEKKEYHAYDVVAYCDKNQVASSTIKCYFGGIRKTIFSSNTAGHYLLTKHPLIFLDGILQPVTNPHYCNNAFVADISCVLYHYKFTPSFRNKVIESRKSNRYIKFAQKQYDQYYKKIAPKESFIIDTPGTRKLLHIQELVINGFLTVSPTYKEYVLKHHCQELASVGI